MIDARTAAAGRIIRAALKNFALADHPSVRAACLVRVLSALMATLAADGDYIALVEQEIGIDVDGDMLKRILEGRLHATRLAALLTKETTLMDMADAVIATLSPYGAVAIQNGLRTVTTEDRAMGMLLPRPWDPALASAIASALVYTGIV